MFVQPEADDEEEEVVVDFVEFGKDESGWKWVVRIYCRPEHARFLRVPNRTSRTLLVAFSQYCTTGSAVHTDGCRGYSALSEHGLIHDSVIYETCYFSPESAPHTQKAERQWVEVRASSRSSRD